MEYLMNFYDFFIVFVYFKKYTIKSVCVSVRPSVRPAVRPSVYTITLENMNRFWWNFLHRLISWISRSSSKMSMIGSAVFELYQKQNFLKKNPWGGPQAKILTKLFSRFSICERCFLIELLILRYFPKGCLLFFSL